VGGIAIPSVCCSPTTQLGASQVHSLHNGQTSKNSSNDRVHLRIYGPSNPPHTHPRPNQLIWSIAVHAIFNTLESSCSLSCTRCTHHFCVYSSLHLFCHSRSLEHIQNASRENGLHCGDRHRSHIVIKCGASLLHTTNYHVHVGCTILKMFLARGDVFHLE
jgi:hypothetical protein